MIDFSNMLGRKLERVTLLPERDAIVFVFLDGFTRTFGVEGATGRSSRFHTNGNCCSESWIEHLEMPGDVVGAILLAVQDSAPITQDHPAHDEERRDECIKVYNTSFRTDRGEIVLEYRNSSNGYYGGSLVDCETECDT